MNKEDKEYLEVLFNDIDRLGIKGNYSVEDLFSCQDLRFIKYNYLKLQQRIDKAINNSQYWIDYYTKLNSDERIVLRLQENIEILKGENNEISKN